MSKLLKRFSKRGQAPFLSVVGLSFNWSPPSKVADFVDPFKEPLREWIKVAAMALLLVAFFFFCWYMIRRIRDWGDSW